jgi:uncharacterized membrane protein
MFLRAFGVWCGFVLVAVINGAVRESVLTPRLGAVRGGQLSAMLLALIILLVTYFSIRWIAPRDSRDAWLVGFCWLLLVLLFEFGFGRAQGMSWSAMLEEYKFWTGKLWVLVLLATTTAPFLTGRLRHLI